MASSPIPTKISELADAELQLILLLRTEQRGWIQAGEIPGVIMGVEVANITDPPAYISMEGLPMIQPLQNRSLGFQRSSDFLTAAEKALLRLKRKGVLTIDLNVAISSDDDYTEHVTKDESLSGGSMMQPVVNHLVQHDPNIYREFFQNVRGLTERHEVITPINVKDGFMLSDDSQFKAHIKDIDSAIFLPSPGSRAAVDLIVRVKNEKGTYIDSVYAGTFDINKPLLTRTEELFKNQRIHLTRLFTLTPALS